MTTLNFNATNVPTDDSFEALPANWYNFTITGSEVKPTKNGDGSYLQAELTVMDGQYAGRKVFDRMNLENKNQIAVEIGYKRLSSYCHATGVMQVQDSQQLHGIPFKARLTVKKDPTGEYEPSNEVKEVKPLDNQVQQMQPAQQNFQQPVQQTIQQQQPQTTGGNPPWMQNQHQQVQQSQPQSNAVSGNPPWVQQQPQQTEQQQPQVTPSNQGVPPWMQNQQ